MGNLDEAAGANEGVAEARDVDITVAIELAHSEKSDIEPAAGEEAEAGLEAAVSYAKQRKQFGQAIADFQGIQFILADMAKDIEVARLLVHSAASKLDAGEDATMVCSMAICFASDIAVQHTANAVQVFGGSGYIRDFEVERLYRDAKITQRVRIRSSV